MANNFEKPDVIVAGALGMLDRELVLAKTIWNDPSLNFKGVRGDSVNVRVPARLKARTRTLRGGLPLQLDELNETSIPLTLTTDVYSGVALSDENLTLDIADLQTQVTGPQMLAVAQEVEDEVGSLMADAAYERTITVDPANPHLSVLDGRQFLNDNLVPMNARFGVLGSGLERAFLADEQLKRADYSGDPSAFRDAVIGSVYGATFVAAQALAPQLGIMFHRTAFVQAMVAPVVPDGASYGRTMSYNGLAMRWIRDYDPLNTADRSLFSVWLGNNTVSDPIDPTDPESELHFVRAVRLELEVASVAVAPASKTLANPGDTQQLTAVATYSDGSTRDVTSDPAVTWTSSAPSKATVSATGLVTAVATGSSNVKATYQGNDSGNCSVTVS